MDIKIRHTFIYVSEFQIYKQLLLMNFKTQKMAISF